MQVNSEDRPWPQPLDHEDLEWPPEDQRILVPFHEAVNVTESSLLGASIAFGSDGTLYLLHSVDPSVRPRTDDIRQDAGAKLTVTEEFEVPVVQRREDHSRNVLQTFVDSHDITSVLLDNAEDSFFSRTGPDQAEGLDCHTVVGTGMDAFEPPASILVPVASGPHSGLATRIAEAVASAYDCWIELFHVLPEDAPEERESDAGALLDTYSGRIDDSVEVDTHVVRQSETADAIVEHSEYHDLTILGAPEKGKLRRFLFGSTTDDVMNSSETKPILTAHRKGTETLLSRWV